MTCNSMCPHCGGAIIQPATGRRKKYCDPACQEMAKNSRRRLDRRLERLEDEEFDLRWEVYCGSPCKYADGSTIAQRLEFVRGEMEAISDKLRSLYA